MKKAGMAAALMLAAQGTAFAEAAKFSPKVGDAWQLVEQRSNNGSTAVVTGRVKVLKSVDDGFEMEWTTLSLAARGQVITGVNKSLLIGVPIRYRAAANGAPLGIIDSAALIDDVIEGVRMLTQDADAAALAQTRKVYLQMDANTLARRFLVEPGLFATCHNLDLRPGEPMVSQTLVDGGFGGPPIIANTTAELVDAGSATAPVRIRIVQALDPKSALESTLAVSTAMRAQKGLPPEKDPPSVMSQQTETSCRLDAKTGETLWVKSDLSISVGPNQRRETRDISVERVR